MECKCSACGKIFITNKIRKDKCPECRTYASIPKICAYCGKQFYARNSRVIYCDGPHYMTCPVCGKVYEVTNRDKLKLPPTACSYACRKVLRERTSLQRYGITAPGNNPEARKKASETMMKNLGVPYAQMSEEVRAKSLETIRERYGCDNVGQNPDIIARRHETVIARYGIYPFNYPESYEKRRKTMLERYGYAEDLANPETREKIKAIMLERYGADHMMRVPELKARQQASLMRHYGVTSAFSSPEVRQKCEQTMIERYGVRNPSFSAELVEKAKQTYFDRHGAPFRSSKINQAFGDKLNEVGIEFESEVFLSGKFYDFLIPSLNTFVEINPSYTHNTFGNHWGDGVDSDYHLKKTILANENGYRCIHVWDWDDQDKIISLLLPRIKIHARKCRIYRLYQDVGNSFLVENHLQGKCRGQLLYLGLVYDDELVQVMTFGKPRYEKKHSVELLRLCTKKGIQVIGGASKLFKFATEMLEVNDIISYCDLSKFDGNIYSIIGMKEIRRTDPQEIWSKGDQKITANLLRQRGYDQLFHTNYGKGSSNEQLMLDHWWLPVYDCGQAVFEYRK